jgi:hypothetical protein
VQPHFPFDMHAGVGIAHATQLAPGAPHAAAVLPGRQLEPEQQPAPHGWVALHALAQVAVAPLQNDGWLGQSAVPLPIAQPQWPPVAVATHTSPFASLAQLVQKPPFAPQLNTPLAPVPAAQVLVPGSQQPPLQGVCSASPQPASHACVVVLQARWSGQSVAALQPQPSPAMHTLPAVEVVQSTHALPAPMQAAALVPAAQLPLVGSQQPLLQPLATVQLDEHTPPTQLSSAGQSLVDTQPHPLPRQTRPDDAVVQSRHAPPVEPQAVIEAPCAHTPAVEQQPPLHGWLAEHVVVHTCATGSQAVSAGQSVLELQPQRVPNRQT